MNFELTIKRNLPIIAILATAAILRFWRLHDLTVFQGDQGFDFLIVKQIVEGNLTLLGPKIGPYNEIGNLYLGPAYYYLLAPFLFISNLDPIGAAILTVSLSLAAIYLIFLVGKEFFSRDVGLIASLLYAINAFLIDQSRTASNPHMIPFFSALAFFSLLKSRKNNSTFSLLICGVSLGIIFQLHYLGISLLAAIIFLNLRYKNIKSLFWIMAGFVAGILPQIMFEIKHHFFVTKIFLEQITSTDSSFSITNAPLQVLKSLEAMDKLFGVGGVVLLFLFLTVFALFHKKIFKKNFDRKFLIAIFLPIPLNIIFASLYSENIHTHYFATTYPFIFLSIGIIMVSIMKAYKKILATILLIVVVAIYAAYNGLNLNLSSTQGSTMPKGWNLTGAKKVSKQIVEDVSAGKSFNIAATLDGDTRARPIRYLVDVYGKKPLDVEKYPDSEILYLISRDDESDIYQYTVWEVASFSPFSIVKSWEIQNGIKLYRLEKENI